MSQKPPCQKRKFSEFEAQLALALSKGKQRTRKNTRRQERRYYFCAECRAFHLTKQA